MKHNFLPSWCVIPAAGSGSRMQADTPKQYLQINGKAVLQHTIERMAQIPKLQGIVVALSENDPYWSSIQVPENINLITTTGGAQRLHSVLNALHVLNSKANVDAWVMVHDAARPCVSLDDVAALHHSINSNHCGAILATPITSTIKKVADSQITETVDRSNLWNAQTPQMFTLASLKNALESALAANTPITDDAQAVMATGEKVNIVHGSDKNIKITWPSDLSLAKMYMENQ